MTKKPGRKKKGNIIVLIDYDNISSALSERQLKLDFADLMIQSSNLGKVDFALIFTPLGSYHTLPKVNNLGYEIIICQKINSNHSEKREDKVDSRMAMIGKSFLAYKEITHVVLMTHDKHSIELASEVIKSGKQLVYFALKENMGQELKEFIDAYNISVYPLPSKQRLGLRSLV